jgi:hypothetical protein
VGCPDTINITNNYLDEKFNQAVALGSVLGDKKADPGNSRLDFYGSIIDSEGAVGVNFDHTWASEGTLWENTGIKNTSLGFGAARGDSSQDTLFRVQGGLEW